MRFETGRSEKVFYAVRGDVLRSSTTWDGKPILVGRPGERGEYGIQAYSEDAAGNRSVVASFSFRIDNREPDLEIMSPVTGIFANAQVFAASFSNVQWVKYTLDGSDPLTSGAAYEGPVILPRQGETTVRVAAQAMSRRWGVLRREVRYTYRPEPGAALGVEPASGVYRTSINLRAVPGPGGSLYYTLWEKTPTDTDYLLSGSLAIGVLPAAKRQVSMRIRQLSEEGVWGPEYRYFYLLYPSAPSQPQITPLAAEPFLGAGLVEIRGPEDAIVRGTLDGTPPRASSPALSGHVEVKVPAGQASAALTVNAAAFDSAGIASAVATRQIQFAPSSTSAPVLAAAAAVGSSVTIASKETARQTIVFEMTSDGSEPAAPSAASPVLSLPMVLSLPYGIDRTFRIRSAFLDAADRVSAPSETLAARLDRMPPAEPAVSPASAGLFDSPLRVEVASEGEVRYTLSVSGADPIDPSTDSPRVAGGAIELRGTQGQIVTYGLKLMGRDENGNLTDIYGPFRYVVDLRAPFIPEITGIADGGRYNQKTISPGMTEVPWVIRYTLATEGSAPAEPDARSPELTKAVSFAGEEGAEKTFRLALAAFSRDGTRKGEVRALSFTMDLKPPDAPVVSGVTDGGRYNRPVTILAAERVTGVKLFATSTDNGAEPEDPVLAEADLSSPLSFDVAEGTAATFTLRIAAVDAAGNRSLYDRIVSFTIDRQPPDDPEILGVPESGVSSVPVMLSLASQASEVAYTLTEDGSQPQVPNAGSPRFVSPMLLSGKAGLAITYRILARAVDDLGNLSRGERMIGFRVDRSTPAPPPEPRLLAPAAGGNTAYLIWEVPAGTQLLYRLSSPPGGEGFVEYSRPAAVDLAGLRNAAVAGQAYAVNEVGGRSPVTTFSKPVQARAATPIIRGVRDKGIAGSKVEIRFEPSGLLVRYELVTSGQYPPTVTASSAVAAGPLLLDALDGESVTFRLAARGYDPSGVALPSEEATISFTIDKAPPAPPIAIGIEDGGYYEEARSLTLLSSEGAIYFSLSPDNKLVIPAKTEENRYRKEILLAAKAGAAMDYRVSAYTVDEAGNRSREVGEWAVTIDQKGVYVAEDGSDSAEGPRSRPLRSLARAWQIASSSARKQVYVAVGEYTLDSTLTIDGDVAIQGGLDRGTWKPSGLGRPSRLSASPLWRASGPLVSVTRGSVSVNGLELSDEAGRAQTLLAVWDGEVALSNVSMIIQRSDMATAVSHKGGKLSVTDCRFRAAAIKNGAFISSAGGSLNVSSTDFKGPDGAEDFSCIDLLDSIDVAFRAVTVAGFTGARTRGIKAVRSRAVLSGSRVDSGAGTALAVAIDAQECELRIENCDITTSASARTPIGLQAADSTVSIAQSRMTAAGAVGSMCVSLRGGTLSLTRSILRGEGSAEYLTLVRAESARPFLSNNLLVAGSANQTICVQARDSALDLFNNTLVAGSGSILTAAVSAQGDTTLRVVNNILVRTSGERGAAIDITRQGAQKDDPLILANCFGGWESLLSSSASAAAAVTRIRTVDSLNESDGDLYEGRIQGNIAEAPLRSFRTSKVEDYHLASTSRCVDGGFDLGDPRGLVGAVAGMGSSDLDGRPRPALMGAPGTPAAWDIGAYEFSD